VTVSTITIQEANTPGLRIRWAREKAGMTGQALADALGVNPSCLSRWESGSRRLPDARAAQAAQLLGVESTWVGTVERTPCPALPCPAVTESLLGILKTNGVTSRRTLQAQMGGTRNAAGLRLRRLRRAGLLERVARRHLLPEQLDHLPDEGDVYALTGKGVGLARRAQRGEVVRLNTSKE